MNLSDIKEHLSTVSVVNFILPNGTAVPQHFHVTEVGQINKKFIDCGGVVRNEKTVNFQLWEAGDFDHRLAPQKLLNIIALSEKTLGIEDAEIEVEYQSSTIGKYHLDFDGTTVINSLLSLMSFLKNDKRFWKKYQIIFLLKKKVIKLFN
jgi:hypothetical protein